MNRKNWLMNLGPTQIENKHDDDWCHICGQRGERGFVLIHVIKNAEHAVVNHPEGTGTDRPVRICEWCLDKLKNHAAKGKTANNMMAHR